MENREIISAIEAILFASGDPVPVPRIALVLEISEQEVLDAAEAFERELASAERGIRLVRLEDRLQLCTHAKHSQQIIRALEQRKPPKLSQSALEVLSTIAYFQPITRAYIDQVRGMDSSYTVGVLCDKGLIEISGRLDVPGRPHTYVTTDAFLRIMGISDLSELPVLPDISTDEGVIELQNKIDNYKSADENGDRNQMSIEDVAISGVTDQ